MIKHLIVALAATAASTAIAQGADPYIWLEEVNGAKPLAQVKQWNTEATAELTVVSGFEEHRQRALAILNNPANIVAPDAVIGDLVLNHWIDSTNPRGVWRVASYQSFVSGKPRWRTLIDVDALGKAEGKSWVWHGADCLAPEYRRCLVSLSPGGGDADVVREFDLQTGQFVAGGFEVPLSKNSAGWVDQDTLLVGRAVAGSETKSGYPVKLVEWKRGTPLDSAPLIATGEVDDISINAGEIGNADSRYPMIIRSVTYFDARRRVRTPDNSWVELPLPADADIMGLVGDRLIVRLDQPAANFPSGALVAYDFDAILKGRKPAPELVLAPGPKQAIEEVNTTDNRLWVKLLEDVSGKLVALRRQPDGRWTQQRMNLPASSTVLILAGADKRDEQFVTVENFITPTSLVRVAASGAATTVQSLPAQFDSSNIAVQQYFAASKDGTKVPYFVVRRKDSTVAGGALVHAYGGFNSAQTPTYLTAQPYRSGPLGLFLVEDGRAYVLANIRGGGEYGPAWHRGALREKRQNSFDDLEAVARDLVARGIARRDSVAISGRSNGAVLVGAAINQNPNLYAATIVGSPLFDMQRYSHLLAGASWVSEYGDPDKPEDWAFMKLYSPYQNVRRDVRYPPMFLYLSTQDDRVHPGHARKWKALNDALGNKVYYHEYLEGGHSVGADRGEDAVRAALEWAFLKSVLPAQGASPAAGKPGGERGR
ncbi:MAG: prolyl oligopeptidase family serine peptidase [Sphingomicrobium sp.]